jgi:hypothetical protein
LSHKGNAAFSGQGFSCYLALKIAEPIDAALKEQSREIIIAFFKFYTLLEVYKGITGHEPYSRKITKYWTEW